jgi:hypothetical protein
MRACRQCGNQNPEGAASCGYCAASLAPAKPSPIPPDEPSPNPTEPPTPFIRKHGIRKQAPPKVFRPESKVRLDPASSAPPIDGKGKGGGIELLPWSELSVGQKGVRAAAGVVVLLLIVFFMSGVLRNVGGSNQNAASQSSEGPLTNNDREDGIASLCKVYQIYGIPKDQEKAVGSAKYAASMFKLGDDQSPERSFFILTMIAGEFSAGKLSDQDCAEVGEPLAKVASPRAGSTPGFDEAKHAFYY